VKLVATDNQNNGLGLYLYRAFLFMSSVVVCARYDCP
jgi:hypothetical protein